MPEFRRIRKKNQQLKEVDKFGVTRIKDGWWIRLGWQNKRPRFQKVIWDKDHNGDHIQSYLQAAAIAKEKRPNYISNFRQPTNLVKGVSLCKQKSKSRDKDGLPMYYYCWKYAYVENKKPKGRTFSFWKTGQLYESFLAMIGFALDHDPEIDLGRVDEYFRTYLNEIDDDIFRNFLPGSDLNSAKKESDRFILKNRYLKKRFTPARQGVIAI